MTTGSAVTPEDPGWARVLRLARRRLESTGGDLTGTLTLRDPTEAERKLIIGLTGAYRPPEVGSLRLPLPLLDASVRREFGRSLVDLLTELGGPLRNRPGERTREARARDELLADARVHGGPRAGEDWFATWLDTLAADGTITRLVRRRDGGILRQVCAVLTLLAESGAGGPADPQRPVTPLSLPVLAEWATGDTKALPGTPRRHPGAAGPRGPRRRDGAGHLGRASGPMGRLRGHPGRPGQPGAGARRAAGRAAPGGRLVAGRGRSGHPVPAHLASVDARSAHADLPGGLRVREPGGAAGRGRRLDCRPSPLICTEGVPSAACHRLLAGVRGTVAWRGDFDWTGLRTTADAIRRYSARPWRMSAADYRRAIDVPGVETESLRGAPADSPWDPALAAALHERGRAVMEERIIPELLADLSAGSTAPAAQPPLGQ